MNHRIYPFGFVVNLSVTSMNHIDHFCFYSFFFVLHFAEFQANKVYHVSSTLHYLNDCPAPCLTLDQLATNSSDLFSVNTTAILLPGKHSLSMNLEVANVTTFTMMSMNVTGQILCNAFSSLSFHNTRKVHITNVKFFGCGGSQFMNVYEFALTNAIFDGKETSITALELIDTAAQINNCIFFSYAIGSFRNLKNQLDAIRKIFGPRTIGLNSNNINIGGAIIANHSTIDIVSSTFENNQANIGGALFVQNTQLTVTSTTFVRELPLNMHSSFSIAGAIYQEKSHTLLTNSYFSKNSALIGGSVFSFQGSLNVSNSTFTSNAGRYGGVLFSAFANVSLQGQFDQNKAEYGGVLRCFSSNVKIAESQLHANNATFGGVILSFNSSIIVDSSQFSDNNADVAGSVVVAAGSTLMYLGSLLISANSAGEFGIVYLSECNGHFLGNATFANNIGTLLAIYSNITFSGQLVFKNTSQPHTTSTMSFQDGGAVSLFQSSAVFDGECTFENNQAEQGGGIHSVESTLNVRGTVTVTLNRAYGNGGGIYLSQSELSCQEKSTLVLFGNVAAQGGGGIHAVGSTVKSTSSEATTMSFINNFAEKGGGIFLETNSKLYVHKLPPINDGDKAVHFVQNIADYGGAIYVDDSTNSAICTIKSSECFFRVVYNSYIIVTPNIATVSFSRNRARTAGSTLFGGLLDRCIVSPFAKLNIYAINAYRLDISGITYFKNVSTEINSSSISSLPTRVCHCIRGHPACSYKQKEPIKVKKGESFSVSVVAVDQIDHPVNAIIQSILKFNGSGLAEGQLTQSIPGECTKLTFNIVTPQNHEVLNLYASNGPCKDAELSTLNLKVQFLPCDCPLGFQASRMNAEINCTCECHQQIDRYMTCDPYTGTLMKKPQSNVWIMYINDTNLLTGYLVFPNCPYSYCNPLSTPIDLNEENGANFQCVFNRSGLLCGSCQPSLSLSLGSSKCLPCPGYWPVVLVSITIVALLAGILLVAILMVLNMTVAVGTLNGLIFYINIVGVNKSVFLPFRDQSFITVFISWMNLELGIDTCFFPGLDTYIKTWIQLAFVAAYVVFLIAFMIIFISSYSTKFTNLIGKRNPVATLSTLVFLSYAKLLEIVFTALSFSMIDYPDGSRLKVWLPDATVEYLQGKHIILFVTTLLLLLVGLVYTALLFSWQWLLCLPNLKMFKWTRNQKLHTFIETYHAPYVHKHRYWTGLLLLVRALLYFVAAINVSNDPQVTLVSVIFTMGFILVLKGSIGRLYKKWPLDVLEMIFYFNLLSLSVFAWYFRNTTHRYRPAAYVSIAITFILLLGIILYHVCKYTVLFAKVSLLGRRINFIISCSRSDRKSPQRKTPPPDELLDMVDRSATTSYIHVPEDKPVKPTYSVVDMNTDTSTTVVTVSTTTASCCQLNTHSSNEE